MAKLTDRSLDALRPRTGRYEIWDDARKGFGVRITPRGVKSFVWVYHFEGKTRRMTSSAPTCRSAPARYRDRRERRRTSPALNHPF